MYFGKRNSYLLSPYNTMILTLLTHFNFQADSSGYSCIMAYLNPGLCEPYLQSQVFPCEDVRVVRGCECLLQLLQLLEGEGGSIAALLATKERVVGRRQLRHSVVRHVCGKKTLFLFTRCAVA